MILMALAALRHAACDDNGLLSLTTSTGTCGVVDNCFQTGSFNQTFYGSNELCTVEVCKDVTYEIRGFSIEDSSSCTADSLTLAGDVYCGFLETPSIVDDDWFYVPGNTLGNLPSATSGSLTSGQTIQFSSDDSDQYQGTQVSLLRSCYLRTQTNCFNYRFVWPR
jgi:hypothetical protein